MAKKKAISKKKDLAGSVIKLSNIEGEYLELTMQKCEACQTAMEVMADALKRNKEVVWKLIFDLYPELEPYNCRYNRITREVTVVVERREKLV